MGCWIARKLNQCEGPVRFLIPEGGVSLLDAPDADFWDPDADTALFAAIEEDFVSSGNRLMYEAQNTLTDQGSRTELRRCLIDKIEGIVRESTRPIDDHRARIANLRAAANAPAPNIYPGTPERAAPFAYLRLLASRNFCSNIWTFLRHEGRDGWAP